jgi:hypothetical protein
LSNRKSFEKSIFVSCSDLSNRTFEEVATVSYDLMGVILEFETEPKE